MTLNVARRITRPTFWVTPRGQSRKAPQSQGTAGEVRPNTFGLT
ncbi:hypothetical protein JOD27_001002 [Lentzea nigeriaca]|nr:hypothetical protein [Lentzea nigeriaca]